MDLNSPKLQNIKCDDIFSTCMVRKVYISTRFAFWEFVVQDILNLHVRFAVVPSARDKRLLKRISKPTWKSLETLFFNSKLVNWMHCVFLILNQPHCFVYLNGIYNFKQIEMQNTLFCSFWLTEILNRVNRIS